MKRIRTLTCLTFIFLIFLGWSTITNNEKQPNILWIFLEDTSPLLRCYGDSTIFFLPNTILTIPELFKNAGYFTFNNGKDDYNFNYNRFDLYEQTYAVHPLYGISGKRLKISELTNKEPFFGQIQLSGGKEIFSATFKDKVKTPVTRNQIKLPPYLPHHPAIIEEYANHLDAIQITDEKLGNIINELNENGILDNTIVFFFSNHGMRLTRHKQFLYEGGVRVPFIVADFREKKAIKPGTYFNELVSGIDFGPTSLALARIPIPEYMEGRDFLSKTTEPREYVISTHDRCDFTIDRIRSVRSKQFKYIRNFMTDRPWTQPTYMDADGVEFVTTMKMLHAENKLDSVQSRFFSGIRPEEELYNLENDPYEINNLVSNPDYSEVLLKNQIILNDWIKSTGDKGQYPEHEEGLKLMLGIWGAFAVNKEYQPLLEKYPDLAGALSDLKSEGWKTVKKGE